LYNHELLKFKDFPRVKFPLGSISAIRSNYNLTFKALSVSEYFSGPRQMDTFQGLWRKCGHPVSQITTWPAWNQQLSRINNKKAQKATQMQHIHQVPLCTRAIPKVSGLDVLDNNIFYNLYISEMYILYKL